MKTLADILDNAPTKVAPFLHRALDRKLNVTQDGRGYRISSPNPIDQFEVWLFYTSGRNGGRLNIFQYGGPRNIGRRKSTSWRITTRMARIVIDDMGDALDRHIARMSTYPTNA